MSKKWEQTARKIENFFVGCFFSWVALCVLMSFAPTEKKEVPVEAPVAEPTVEWEMHRGYTKEDNEKLLQERRALREARTREMHDFLVAGWECKEIVKGVIEWTSELEDLCSSRDPGKSGDVLGHDFTTTIMFCRMQCDQMQEKLNWEQEKLMRKRALRGE